MENRSRAVRENWGNWIQLLKFWKQMLLAIERAKYDGTMARNVCELYREWYRGCRS